VTHERAAADIGAPLLLTLVVTDGRGRPLANQMVTLSTTRQGDVLSPTVAITDDRGEVRVTLTATTLGAATIVARAGAAPPFCATFRAGLWPMRRLCLPRRSRRPL
jgi:hypothetical protein